MNERRIEGLKERRTEGLKERRIEVEKVCGALIFCRTACSQLFHAFNYSILHALLDSHTHNHHVVGLVFGGAAPLFEHKVQQLALLAHRLLVDFQQ